MTLAKVLQSLQLWTKGKKLVHHSGSISSTFYKQLLRLQIPNAQKKTVKLAVSFGAFGTYKHKSCTKMLLKLTHCRALEGSFHNALLDRWTVKASSSLWRSEWQLTYGLKQIESSKLFDGLPYTYFVILRTTKWKSKMFFFLLFASRLKKN